MPSLNTHNIDLLQFGFITLDSDRNILHCNAYALKLLSCGSNAEVEGQNFKSFVSPATQIFLDSYTYPMLLNEGMAEEVQLGLKSIIGESVPIIANIELHSDKKISLTFMGCGKRDKLYDELIGARDTLQSQAQDLTKLNDQIQQRQVELQTFCQSLSHDFTGPLRRINQMIEYAQEDFQKACSDAPEAFDMLNRAQKNADTLLDLTNGLVEYLVADVPVSHGELVNLDDIVLSILDMTERQNGIKPEFRVSALPTFSGNKTQIHVLFKNLIENAIRYNENTPVVSISHTEDVANNSIVITIKDNGIGMPAEYIDSIFTPFTQLHAKNKYRGCGLGLSIVKKMVFNHQGSIRVESTLGCGSTFYVTLPRRTHLADNS